MAGNGHDECLICGFRNPWSLGMRFDAGDDGTVTARFRGNARLQGYYGLLHGGVLATLLDSAMVHCLFHRGVEGVTGDLHVRFVRPVAYDTELEVRAHILTATPPLYYLKAEVFDGHRIMAWGEATFMKRARRETPTRMRSGAQSSTSGTSRETRRRGR